MVNRGQLVKHVTSYPLLVYEDLVKTPEVTTEGVENERNSIINILSFRICVFE